MKRFTLLTLLLLASPSWAQETLRVGMRFLAFHKAEILQPASISLRVEITNPTNAPRWLLTHLLERGHLPEDGKFASPGKDDFPVQCLKFEGDAGKGHATLVHFQGTPPFDAFLLPAGAKIVLEGLRLDAAESSEFAFAEASALLVDGKQPLEKWLGLDLASSQAASIPEKSKVEQILVDPATGALREGLPKEPIRFVEAKFERRWTLPVEGYEHPPVYYKKGTFHPKEQAITKGPWRPLATFEPTGNLRVEQLAFAPDGKRLYVSLQHLKIAGLDTQTGKEIVLDGDKQGFCRLLDVTPQGQVWVRQMRGVRDRNARGFLNLTTGERIKPTKIETLQLDWVKDGTLSPDRKLLALSDGTEAYVWDLVKDEQVAHFKMDNRPDDYTLMSLTFSPDQKQLAGCFVGSKTGAAVLWDLQAKKQVADIRHPHKLSPLHLVAFSPDSKSLVLVTRNAREFPIIELDKIEESLEKVKARTWPRTATIPQFSVFHALAFSPDGKYLAAHCHPVGVLENTDLGPFVWTADGKSVGQFTGLHQPAYGLAFSPDGRLLAAGDAQGTVRIWTRE